MAASNEPTRIVLSIITGTRTLYRAMLRTQVVRLRRLYERAKKELRETQSARSEDIHPPSDLLSLWGGMESCRRLPTAVRPGDTPNTRNERT